MDYKSKYYKYKTKYIELKNKISGGSLPKVQNYRIMFMLIKNEFTIIVKEYNKGNLSFDGYKIVIDGDVNNNKVNIYIIFSSEIVNEIRIFIKNVLVTQNEKNEYSLNLNGKVIITEIKIKYNDDEIETYNNLEITNEIKKYMN